MKATYLLIKSSVLSVTDQQKPVYSDFSANSALDFSYEEKLEAFNDSFIKVDNPEAFWNQADLPSALRVKMNMREREDGLYPAPDGIEFEVKEETEVHYSQRDIEDGNVPMGATLLTSKLSAVVSLIDAKENGQSGEPGNEAKKLPTLKDYNHQRYAHYDKPLDNNAGVACEKCGKEMQYVDQNLVTLGNPPSTKVTCECGNSGYKVL